MNQPPNNSMQLTALRAAADAERSCLASDFVVLVLSEAVLSATVLVLDGCLNYGTADR
jgi:hypothetical protein